jgi:hypothetical protein
MSIPTYRELILALLERGYEIKKYRDAIPSRRHLILRHDVDMCLNRAVEMAQAEADIGAQSYYFVLVNTEFYNVASRAGRDALRAIGRLGHSVGLHFDPAGIAEGSRQALEDSVANECTVLECYLEAPVDVVTFHRPPKFLMGDTGDLAGRIHGYQPRFFQDMGYCSDSEGRFRFHHPLDHPAVLENRAMQLVLHPIWWCAAPDENAVGKLIRFRREREATLDRLLAENCRPYASRSGLPRGHDGAAFAT